MSEQQFPPGWRPWPDNPEEKKKHQDEAVLAGENPGVPPIHRPGQEANPEPVAPANPTPGPAPAKPAAGE